jgi:ATP synthase protein I
MKLLRPKKRVNAHDSLGQGMDAVIMLVLFFAAGFGLDRIFETTPLFMIGLTIIGSVGLFAKFKYRYDARMEELEAERLGTHKRSAADREKAA